MVITQWDKNQPAFVIQQYIVMNSNDDHYFPLILSIHFFAVKTKLKTKDTYRTQNRDSTINILLYRLKSS